METKQEDPGNEMVNRHMKATSVKFYVPELKETDNTRSFFIIRTNSRTFRERVVSLIKGKKEIKIRMSESFKKYFFDYTPAVVSLPAMSFVRYKIVNGLASDTDILEFSKNFNQKTRSSMESRERILWIIANLTQKPKVIGTFFCIVDYYFCKEDLTLRAISVSYNRFYSEIYCDCSSLDKGSSPRWSSGNNVLYEI